MLWHMLYVRDSFCLFLSCACLCTLICCFGKLSIMYCCINKFSALSALPSSLRVAQVLGSPHVYLLFPVLGLSVILFRVIIKYSQLIPHALCALKVRVDIKTLYPKWYVALLLLLCSNYNNIRLRFVPLVS